MKKIYLLLLSAVVLMSCEGPQGPPGFDGFDGRDGQDGVNIVAQSFEVELDFDAPDYEQTVVYPADIEVFDTDMTLVYILFDVTTDQNGDPLDVWRLLPQTLYSDFGEYQYNFDATNLDTRIFLDGPASTNFNLLGAGDLEDQIFRIVILPVDLANNPNLDVSDYNSVMNVGGLTTEDIITIE